MNKFCVVNYFTGDKNRIEVCDYNSIRVINCNYKNSFPGMIARLKIRKYSRGFQTFDKLGFATDCLCFNSRDLFRRDIAGVVRQFCSAYGIDCSVSEIAIYGSVPGYVIKGFSEMFSMVWLYGCSSEAYHNTFEIKSDMKISARFALYVNGDFDMPDSEFVFNLSDKMIPAINNIEVCADGFECVSPEYRNEIVRLSGADYRIISFIK